MVIGDRISTPRPSAYAARTNGSVAIADGAKPMFCSCGLGPMGKPLGLIGPNGPLAGDEQFCDHCGLPPQAKEELEEYVEHHATWPSLFALAIFCGVVFTVLAHQWKVAPSVVPASAPLEQGFSAERTRSVLVDLAACGIKMVGTHANEVCAAQAVKKHIHLASQGYEKRVAVEMESVSGHYYQDFLLGLTSIYRNLTNVVARVRGRATEPGCALLISSHFDSTYGSPAASDANAEIAIMIELLRLFAHSPPAVDIIFNFNGGEEMLMPAAHGFITSHRWASNICAVVNLESAGSGGRALLFQVGPRNRWIAETYAKHVEHPYGSSLVQVLFSTGTIPGDTDFRIYRDFGGIPGADFVVVANGWVYHTSRDDLEHLDFRSLQRYGDNTRSFALGLAEVLSTGVPTGAAANEAAVFFDFLGIFSVTYPAPLAQKLHISVSLLALTWMFRGVCEKKIATVCRLAGKLCLCFLASILASVMVAIALSFSPAALAYATRPQLLLLLYVPPAVLGFIFAYEATIEPHTCKKGKQEVAALHNAAAREVAAAARVFMVVMTIVFSLSSVVVLASYWLFAHTLFLCLGETFFYWLDTVNTRFQGFQSTRRDEFRECLLAIFFIVPWILDVQIFMLSFDLFCPLTMRSGTAIPGDLIIGLVFGFLFAFMNVLSTRFIVHMPRKTLTVGLICAFLWGISVAMVTFPYSYDRPKRVYVQHIARSANTWDFTSSSKDMDNRIWTALNQNPLRPTKSVVLPTKAHMDSGILTVAMDSNNLGTLEKHSAFGLPPGSAKYDSSVGLYGEMPLPFPIRYMVAGGSWLVTPPPHLPNRLSVTADLVRHWEAGQPLLQADQRYIKISVAGGAIMSMALGPRSLVINWSYGFYNKKGSLEQSANWSSWRGKGLPAGLPPARPDCDCFWMLYTEGGAEPSKGKHEAFSFIVATKPGKLTLEVSAIHTEESTREISEYMDRMPHWVSKIGWVSEFQKHDFLV